MKLPKRWRGPFTHLPDYAENNSPMGIEHAAAHSGAIDVDVLVTRDGVPIALHSPIPARDGFRGPGADRNVATLTWAQVARLRTASGIRIYRLASLLDLAAEKRLRRVELDAKNSRQLEHAATWRPIADHVAGLELEVFVKTSSTNPRPRRAGRRLRAASRTGLPTVLLPRGAGRMPARFRRFITHIRPYRGITRVRWTRSTKKEKS